MESGNEVWTGLFDLARESKPAESRLTALDAQLHNIIVVRSGDTLLANIRVAGELYRLVPIDNGAHALVEVDQSKFIVDEDANAYAEMLRNSPAPDAVEEPPRVGVRSSRQPWAGAHSPVGAFVAGSESAFAGLSVAFPQRGQITKTGVGRRNDGLPWATV